MVKEVKYMIDSEMTENVLHSSVNECHAKLCLILDYFERFKIKDVRILAPIHDIERCIDMMSHVLQKDGQDDCYHE